MVLVSYGIVYSYCSYFIRKALSFNLAAYTVISSWQVPFCKFACPQGGAWHQHTLMLDCPQLPVGNPILTQSASQPEEGWKGEAERGMNRWDVRDEDWKVWVITDLVRLCVFRVFLLILVALWCLVMTPGAFGQLPELTGEKNECSSLSNTWLPNQFQIPFACQTYTQTVLLLFFSSGTRQILINLKMHETCSAAISYIMQRISCFILFYCLYFFSVVSSKIRSFHTRVGSNQTQCLFSCSTFSFYPTDTEKLQGTAIRVSSSTTCWNSFPALCPLSPWKMLTNDSIFVYCNQSSMCMSKAFCCPYANKLFVDYKSIFSENGHSSLFKPNCIFSLLHERHATAEKLSAMLWLTKDTF